MKSLISYVAIALASLVVATALGFVLGSLMDHTVATFMHAVATI